MVRPIRSLNMCDVKIHRVSPVRHCIECNLLCISLAVAADDRCDGKAYLRIWIVSLDNLGGRSIECAVGSSHNNRAFEAGAVASRSRFLASGFRHGAAD